MPMTRPFAVAVLVVFVTACATVDKPLPTIEEIQGYGKLSPFMKAKGRLAQPYFKKVNSDWSGIDWNAVTESAQRLQTSSALLKTKFSHGEEWDQLADALAAQADAFHAAATSKDEAGTKAAITDLKRACNACHTKAKEYKWH